MLPALVIQAPVSLVERKERSGPAVEAQDEEQHLAKDPFDHQQPQEVVDLQDHLFHCALHVKGGISESAGCFHYRPEDHFIRDCPHLVAAETSEVGTVASTPGTSGPSQAGRGGSGRGGSTTPGRGRGRGVGGRGSTPISQIQSGTRTQARVFTVIQ